VVFTAQERKLEPVLVWAADQMGAGATVVTVQRLRKGIGPWRLRIDRRGKASEVVLRVGDLHSREQLAIEAAALTFAEEHELAAPRLLAVDLDEKTAGSPVLLTTALPGSSRAPAAASPERLRALGAAAARVHAEAAAPRPGLPLRVRPYDVDFAAQRRANGSSPLLDAAQELIDNVPVPAGGPVFVHGDLWQGNTIWSGDAFVGMVDWEAAGVGHPGIDLGILRLDTAILFGPPAAAAILDGWRKETGEAADATAYWDVVAALTTSAVMEVGQWLAVVHEQGRVDLDAATVTGRRNAFLRVALDQLDWA
jgi:aminoglycoside phosphotransferase (APT) family kinase protein